MRFCHPDRSGNPRALLRLLAGLLFLSAFSACAGPDEKDYSPQGQHTPVYVVSHGWHTGIVIAAENLGSELAFLDDHFETASWYEIGWGDREFYQAGETTIGLALRAGLWPTDTVLHVTALPESPDTYFSSSRVIEIAVAQTGHERMVRAMSEDFVHNERNEAIVSGDGLYGESLFFEARGRFHAFNTCNTWVARMLDTAGVPIQVFATVTASDVMSQIEDGVSSHRCCAE